MGVPREDIVPVGKLIPDFVKENRLEDKIDTVLEFVGMHQTFQDAQKTVRPAGKVLCIGTLDLKNELDMKNGIKLHLLGVINPQVETGKLEEFPTGLKNLCDGKIKDRYALLPHA
ncbi:hypothetical protein AJ80_04147 [Polytolypa hystricis UAMH7299]|uniref:Alcohol dehydrogenase-like C-terminal domain-containing protein n=1 Tax=Polytolypa hystricis (strain UAMH7299) TaxID=1447883 RepID=A0A2B7YE46_POLH7|nr:hypothetical protein AJ80_04147 [Polytolypa hystricis UAMH7299]